MRLKRGARKMTDTGYEPNHARRHLLRTGLLSSALATLGSPSTTARAASSSLGRPPRPGKFDYADPGDNLFTLSRMWGSVDPGQLAYLYVFGPAFAMTDAQSFRPLFRLESVAAVRTYPVGGGAYRYLAGQVILFTDWKTGEVLERFRNPLTDEWCNVFQYRDGPLDYTIDPAKMPEHYAMANDEDLPRKLVLDWSFRGDMAYGDAIVRTRLKNRLDPAVWKRESVGEWWETFESYRWEGKRAEIEDRSLAVIPSFRGDFQTFKPWEPWMLMGNRPGKILQQKTAFQIADLSVVPKPVSRYIERHLPEILRIGTDFHGQYKLNDAHFKEQRTPIP